MLRTLGLQVGATVTVTIEGGRMVLTPTRPRYELASLLAGMPPGDMPTDERWSEARPAGEEAW